MDHQQQRPDFELVRTLANLASRYGKLYCYPSQEKLIELHAMRTGRTYSRATINRHLRAHIASGYLRTKRRHRRAADGSLELHSTLYEITQKTLARLSEVVHSLKRWFGDKLWVRGSFRCLRNETKASASLEDHKAGGQNRPPAQGMTGASPGELTR